MKSGPVVVWDASRADHDSSEAEEQTDVAGSNEQSVFPEGHQGVPLRQGQLYRIADRTVRSLLLLASRLLLLGRGRRRDLERECRMTAGVERRVFGRQSAVSFSLLDLQRSVDESAIVQTHL